MNCRCHATRVEHLDYALAIFAAERAWAERNGLTTEAWGELTDKGLDRRLTETADRRETA